MRVNSAPSQTSHTSYHAASYKSAFESVVDDEAGAGPVPPTIKSLSMPQSAAHSMPQSPHPSLGKVRSWWIDNCGLTVQGSTSASQLLAMAGV